MSDSDWRLMGQDRHLADAVLTWATWRPVKPGWDHDHCAFCQAEISDRPIDEHTAYNAAWVTSPDQATWICPVCFEDFQVRFGWNVAQAE